MGRGANPERKLLHFLTASLIIACLPAASRTSRSEGDAEGEPKVPETVIDSGWWKRRSPSSSGKSKRGARDAGGAEEEREALRQERRAKQTGDYLASAKKSGAGRFRWFAETEPAKPLALGQTRREMRLSSQWLVYVHYKNRRKGLCKGHQPL